jgi:hypothetical protein
MAFWMVSLRNEGTTQGRTGSPSVPGRLHVGRSGGEDRIMTHYRLRQGSGLRLDVVMRVRAAIARGGYEDDALDACLDGLLTDLAV